MNLADEIDQLMVEYSFAMESSSARSSKSRKFKCGFCFRTYKYYTILADHVYSKEIFIEFSSFFDLKNHDENLEN